MSSESAAQNAIRLEYARRGYNLFRNNNGVLKNENGVPVRYGLANETKEENKIYKSSDLIGWRTVTVTPEMVGRTVAIFCTFEAKPSDWRPALSGEKFDHEQAQMRWIDMVVAAGGEGAILTGAG